MSEKIDHHFMLTGTHEKVSRKENRAFKRDAFIFNLTEDVLVAMHNAGISKDELSRRLNVPISELTKLSDIDADMTLSTLFDICYELGLTPAFNLNALSHEPNKEQT